MRLQATSGNRAVQRQVHEATIQRLGEDHGYGVYKQVQLPDQAAPEAAAAVPAAAPAAPGAAADIAPGYVPYTPHAPSPAAAPSASAAAASAEAPGPASRGAASATATASPTAVVAGAGGPQPTAWPPGLEPRAELQMFGNHPALPSRFDQPAGHAPAQAAVAPQAPPARLAQPAARPAAAAAAAGHPAPLQLPASYAGEDRMLGWRAWHGAGPPDAMHPVERAARERMAGTSDRVTHYNTPEETRASTLTPARAADGAPQLQDAAGRPADFGPRVYAMGTEGQVVANSGPASSNVGGQRQDIHHSSMLAGADVAHAGHIGARGGRVNYLDDDSGHYRPTGAHTFDAFSRLAGQGALDPTSTSGRVHMVDKSVGKGLGARGPSASVHFAAYAQTQGNEAAIRAKAAMLGQFERAAAARAAAQPAVAAAAAAPPSPVVVPSPQVAPAATSGQPARPAAAASAEVMDVATPLPSRPASPAAADDDGGLVFDDGPPPAPAAAALAAQPEEIDLPAQPASAPVPVPVPVPMPATAPAAADDDGGLVFDDSPATAPAVAALAAQPEEIDLPAQPASAPVPVAATSPAAADDDGGLVFDDRPAASAAAAALAAQPEEIDLPVQPAATPTSAPAAAPAR